VPESLFPGLTARDLEEGSFYELIVSRYGIQVVGGTQTVEPTVTNDEESNALGVPLHSPALLFERITHSAAGETVEYTSSIYRGDRYRIVSELGVGGHPSTPIGFAARALDNFA
jgi:GntR family transcriptional regulator